MKKLIVYILMHARIRIKARLLGKEWSRELGNPLADTVVFQLALTIPPQIVGVDIEVFV